MNKRLLLSKRNAWPQVFRILPIAAGQPEKEGTWASYPLDDSVQFWVDSSHPEAIDFYQKLIKQREEYEMSKALTVIEENSIKSLISKNIKAIASVLPKHLTPERAMRIAYTALVKNPILGRCTQESLMNSIVESSSLGLEIGGPLRQATLIPFNNKRLGAYEATLVVEYPGLINLAMNTGNVKNVSAYAVFEKDDFDYRLGLNPDIHHIPSNEVDPGPITHAYAVINYINGGVDFEVIGERVAMDAKGRSAAKFKKDSPWNKKEDQPAMWKKTAIRRLMNRVPKSSEKLGSVLSGGQTPNHVIDIKLDDMQSIQIPEKTPVRQPLPKGIPLAQQKTAPVEEKPQAQKEPMPETVATDIDPKLAQKIAQIKTLQDGFPEEFQEACDSLGLKNDPDSMTSQECLAVNAALNSICRSIRSF